MPPQEKIEEILAQTRRNNKFKALLYFFILLLLIIGIFIVFKFGFIKKIINIPSGISSTSNEQDSDDIYYQACVTTNNDIEKSFLKLNKEEKLKTNTVLPTFIKFNNSCYHLVENNQVNDTSDIQDILIANVAENKSCENECFSTGGLDNCLSNNITSSVEGKDGLYLNGKRILPSYDECNSMDSKDCSVGDYYATFFPTKEQYIFSTFGSHYAYVQTGPICEIKDTLYGLCNNGDLCPKRRTLCSGATEQLIYDGAVVYESPALVGKNKNITSVDLYGNSILAYINDGSVFFDGKIFNNIKINRGSCVFSSESFLCNDTINNKIYLNGTLLGNGNFIESNSYFKGNFIFKNWDLLSSDLTNTALKYYNNKLKKIIDFKIDLGGINYTPNHKVFGEHVAYIDTKLIYDNLLISNDAFGFDIFGDSFAYIELSRDDNRTLIVKNGTYYDVDKKMGKDEGYMFDKMVGNIKLYNNHLSFTYTDNNDQSHLVYDWVDLGEVKYSDNIKLFNDHLVYTKEINGDTHIIYDGKDMGVGEKPIIYNDHLYFDIYRGDEIMPEKYYYDGKIYTGQRSVRDNIESCYRYHLENNVPTSPYGTIKY
jgi:hypothetical protein